MPIRSADQLYLQLIKNTLTHSLWPEPLLPLEAFNYGRSFPKKQIIDIVSAGLAKKNLQIGKVSDVGMDKRKKGYWSPVAETMIGSLGLDNIQFCVEKVLEDNIEGDLIETGVWRGGACIFMRAILAVHGVMDRRVYVADSFKGLPKPDSGAFPNDKNDQHWTYKFLAVTVNQVRENFKKYDLLDDQVVFLEGWFKDTLPKLDSKQFAVMRLDGDMYESTWQALTYLYPRLSPGGFCIIDDYHLEGCRKAVDEYRASQKIISPIEFTEAYPIYWRK
jgi:O-methyltransferase